MKRRGRIDAEETTRKMRRGTASPVLRRLPSVALLGVALLSVAFGCSDLRMDPAVNHIQVPITDPSFTNDIMPVLRATCASSGACHGNGTVAGTGNGPQLGLDMSTDSAAYANLVNVVSQRRAPMLRVMPGFPDSSFMFRVLSSNQSIRLGYPYRMPLTEYALPTETQQTIANWITKGAQFN